MLTRIAAIAFVFLLAGKDPGDAKLVGTWGLGGHSFVTFNADGTGTMEGDGFIWKSDGKTISITSADGEKDQMTYVVKDGQLALQAGGVPMALTKIGGKGAKAAAKVVDDDDEEVAVVATSKTKKSSAGKTPVPDAAPAAAGKAGNDPVSQLLLSSAWCTFHYNATSGASSSSRVQFFTNGTWRKGAQGETYASGANGTYAGQSNSTDGGNWMVQNGTLMITSGQSNGQFVPLPFNATRNPNGSVILKGDGVEYSQCQ